MKKITLLILILMVDSLCSNAQTITTIAGTGTSGVTGDGGPATAARVSNLGLCCFDGRGNFYFIESQGTLVQKIDTSGIITTVVGNGTIGFSGDGGPATSAKIYCSNATVDSIGNIYVADYYNNRVRKVNVATGIIQTICGNGTAAHTGDGGPATAATIEPVDIITDRIGNIYISDNGTNTRKIDTFGIITSILDNNGLGMAVDDINHYLFIGINFWIIKLNLITYDFDTIAGRGGYLYNGDGIPADSANFRAHDLARDQLGNIYIADYLNNRARQIDTSDIIHTVAGTGIRGYSGDGGSADSAMINYPTGVAIDPCGNLYIADNDNFRIRKVTYPPIPTDTPHISISASTSDTTCIGNTVTYTASFSGGGRRVGYEWYVNATARGAGSTYTYTPANGDSIQCLVTTSNPCSDTLYGSSNVLRMTVNPIDTATIALSGPSSAAIGSSVTISATLTGAGSSYTIRWFNHGTQFSTTAIPSVTYTKALATDSITARVVPGNDCADSVLSVVHVVTNSKAGVAEMQANGDIQIYPNPAHNNFTITSSEPLQSVVVMDLLGREMYSGKEREVDVRDWKNGVYFVRVNGIYCVRFVKM